MKITPLVLLFSACAIAVIAMTIASFAQQTPVQTPAEQALTMKLSEEITVGMQDRVALIAARRKVDELQKQLDDLKPKDGPRAVEPAK